MMMKALKAFDYNNRKLKAGDVFELANEHGDDAVHRHLLISGHLAEDAVDDDGDLLPKKKRIYKRRDMVSEE
jgi:hypothetical protein